MSNTIIQIKRSITPGLIPSNSNVSFSELAINITDRKIFTKNENNDIIILTDYELSNSAYNIATNSYSTANLIFDKTNTAFSVANSAYDLANTGNTLATGAYGQANAAFYKANLSVTIGDTVLFLGNNTSDISGLSTLNANNISVSNSFSISTNNLIQNLNADLLDGHDTSVNNSNNTIVVRDLNGYVNATGIFLNSIEGGKYIQWNDTDATFDVQMLDGESVELGEKIHIYGKATENITKNTIVMFAGAQGANLLLRVANTAVAGFKPEWIVGVAAHDILNNNFGYVTFTGKIRDVDTYNFNEGDVLYINPANSSGFSNVAPTAPNNKSIIAAVLKKSTSVNSNNGVILVRPTFVHNIDSLSDVHVNNLAANNILAWNNTSSRWENKSISDIGGVTGTSTGFAYLPINMSVSGNNSISAAQFKLPADTYIELNGVLGTDSIAANAYVELRYANGYILKTLTKNGLIEYANTETGFTLSTDTMIYTVLYGDNNSANSFLLSIGLK